MAFSFRLIALFLAPLLFCPRVDAQSPRPVELELLLAVDVSSSVDGGEYDLQMRGLSEAFRHPDVQTAIRAIGRLGVAVAVVQWSDSDDQSLVIDWTVVHDAASTEALAERIANTKRVVSGSQTAIAGALKFSLAELTGNDFEGRRQVIDVSGDGRANSGDHPMAIRDLAIAKGVVINGLAILNEEPFVDSYYRYTVIGGDGAFLMTAYDYEDFAVAILEKLIREIDLPPISGRMLPGPVLADRGTGGRDQR